MPKHPFEPIVFPNSKKILVGTLPPENVEFYFSNSSNTRLWDILISIKENKKLVSENTNSISKEAKIDNLKSLDLGLTDIIFEYERKVNTTKDSDIIPISYNDILELAYKNNIESILFVYQSALKWFYHSITKESPVVLRKLRSKCEVGNQKEIKYKGKAFQIILLPPPLNRGKKGQTLEWKLNIYKKHIKK